MLGPWACAYLGGEIFEDGGAVHGGGGSHSAMGRGAVLQMPMNTTHGELTGRDGHGHVNTVSVQLSASDIPSVWFKRAKLYRV